MFLSAIVYPHSPHSLEVEAFKVRRKRSDLKENYALGMLPSESVTPQGFSPPFGARTYSLILLTCVVVRRQ